LDKHHHKKYPQKEEGPRLESFLFFPQQYHQSAFGFDERILSNKRVTNNPPGTANTKASTTLTIPPASATSPIQPKA
jgi:hypothetical protein